MLLQVQYCHIMDKCSQLQSISFLHLRLSELKPSVYVMEKVAGFDRKKARLFFF